MIADKCVVAAIVAIAAVAAIVAVVAVAAAAAALAVAAADQFVSSLSFQLGPDLLTASHEVCTKPKR